MKTDPRIKILYLVAVSLLAFVLGRNAAILLLIAQGALWLISRTPLAAARYLRKAAGFILMVLLFYAFFSGQSDFLLLRLGHFDIRASSAGLLEGLGMSLRFLTVLLGSIIVRHATGREEFIRGLVGLRMPHSTAILFDSTLAYVEGREHGGQSGEKERKNGSVPLRRLLRGDFSVLSEFINRPLAAARGLVADSDMALVLGLTIIVVSVRFLKVVAGFPLAPGHKNLIIVPCFIAAAGLTRSRFAATQIGFVSGIINFMSGFGRFGVFDILQSAAPGLTVDMLVKLTGRSQSLFVYSLIGLVAGLARATTVFVLALLFRMPGEFYVALAPLALSQCAFGALSAPVARYMVKNIKQH